jgi:hypothetical protein
MIAQRKTAAGVRSVTPTKDLSRATPPLKTAATTVKTTMDMP